MLMSGKRQRSFLQYLFKMRSWSDRLNREERYGGLELDLHSIVMAEELGVCRSSAVSMAIGVQTDMCTPALSIRFRCS